MDWLQLSTRQRHKVVIQFRKHADNRPSPTFKKDPDFWYDVFMDGTPAIFRQKSDEMQILVHKDGYSTKPLTEENSKWVNV